MPISKRRVLSRSLSVEGIIGQHYKRNGNYVATRIDDAAAEVDFLDTVCRAFEALQRLPTGQNLLDEIEASGKTCVIFCGSPRGMVIHAGAAILQDVGDKRATLDRYAIPVSDYGTMLINDDPGGDVNVNVQEVIDRRRDNVRRYYENTLTDQEKEFRNNNTGFQAVFTRVSRDHGNTEQYIADRCGLTADKVSDYLFGDARIDTSDNFKLSFGLYPYLIRGAGADTAVRLTAEIGVTSPGNTPTWFQKRRGSTRFSLHTEEVRSDVMLGHELVHAWRMMTGRRIVATGWEEEMMTVGLGPGAELRFTENRLRSEAGHPARTTYPTLTGSTRAGQAMHRVYN